MIKKRISGAVVVKNHKVVQSFGYNKYLPLGAVTPIVQNLDRWSVDEITILDIDRTRRSLGPNLSLLNDICSIPISTPLTYAGGITNVDDALKVIDSGVERIILDNLFINDYKKIIKISEAIGSQAIIISIPIKVVNGKPYHFEYLTKKTIKLEINKIIKLKDFFSEIMLTDVNSQGVEGLFQDDLVSLFSKVNTKLICFGGVGIANKGSNLLNNDHVNAIIYGNLLNYGELFFQKIKRSLKTSKKNQRRSIYREKI